jgi:predicted enzyme related to lactoylglutathione lyase
MPAQPRLVAVVLEVADVERSAKLYRDGFGIDLHDSDHDATGDRWIGGRHAAKTWSDGAFLHFALYESRGEGPTTGAQVAFAVADLEEASVRALAAGAALIHGPVDQPWGRSSRFHDLDGNVIELTMRV